jgi:hypothetical protein
MYSLRPWINQFVDCVKSIFSSLVKSVEIYNNIYDTKWINYENIFPSISININLVP